MAQIDPGTLDYSDSMKVFFRQVAERLVDRFGKSPEEARRLITVYFQLGIDPLERALLMHSGAESVADDLAAMGEATSASDAATGPAAQEGRSRLATGW